MIAFADIRLRAAEPDDLELAYTIENDVSMWPYSATNVPYSRFTLKRFLEENTADIYTDKQVRLTVEWEKEKGTWVAVGFADLFNFDPYHRRAEIGLAIAQEYQAKHLGEKAIVALIEYAVMIDLHVIYAIISAQNKKASHLFELQDFNPSTQLSDWLWNGNEYESAIVWQKVIGRGHESCLHASRP